MKEHIGISHALNRLTEGGQSLQPQRTSEMSQCGDLDLVAIVGALSNEGHARLDEVTEAELAAGHNHRWLQPISAPRNVIGRSGLCKSGAQDVGHSRRSIKTALSLPKPKFE